MRRETSAMLFCDVAGYSDLTEAQLRAFLERILPAVSAVLDGTSKSGQPPPREQLTELNTWGDAIVAVSRDPYVLARLALDIRDFYKGRNWLDDHLPQTLSCRIALHAGVIFVGHDPIRNRDGVVGTQVNMAARIEPVTTPGEVWVSEQFMKLIDPKTDPTLAFDDLGERPLAKRFGSARLYHLRRAHESPDRPRDIQVQPLRGPTSKELEIAIHMAKHGTEEQRRAALDVLDQFNNAEAVATLLEVARDKSSPHRLRRMALASLGVLRSPIAVPDLVTIVEDPQEMPDIVAQAIEVLGEIRDVRAVSVIERALLGALSAKGMRVAISALAKIGDPAGAAILRQMLADRKDRFRPVLDAAVMAAGVFGDQLCGPVLQEIARDRDNYPTDLRQAALSSLILCFAHQSEDLFIKLATDEAESRVMREIAIGALAAAPSHRTAAVLAEIASDLASPLAARAMLVMAKGASMLEREKEILEKMVRGELRRG